MSKPDSLLRLLSKVKLSDSGCLEWTGSTNRDGYGIITMGSVARTKLAHRLSWTMMYGPIGDRLCVLHKCDNPPCVNPNHLFIGTDKDNVHDMISKNRFNHWNKDKTHCKRGHEFTEENTYWRPEGKRTCRTCDAYNRRNRKLKKEKLNVNK